MTTPTEPAQDKVTQVYLRSSEHCWIPALQLKTTNGKARIALPKFKTEQELMSCSRQGKKFYHDSQLIDLADYTNGVLPMQNVDANGSIEDYKDMVELPFMHEVSSTSLYRHCTTCEPAKAQWLSHIETINTGCHFVQS